MSTLTSAESTGRTTDHILDILLDRAAARREEVTPEIWAIAFMTLLGRYHEYIQYLNGFQVCDDRIVAILERLGTRLHVTETGGFTSRTRVIELLDWKNQEPLRSRASFTLLLAQNGSLFFQSLTCLNPNPKEESWKLSVAEVPSPKALQAIIEEHQGFVRDMGECIVSALHGHFKQTIRKRREWLENLEKAESQMEALLSYRLTGLLQVRT